MHFFITLLLLAGIHSGHCNVYKRSMRVIRSDDSDSWSYDSDTDTGPSHWPGDCQTGIWQSPVDIGGPRRNLTAARLKFDGAYNKATSWLATWNGHAYSAVYEKESEVSILEGGDLEDDYIFQSLHLHFGSEHTINGERFTAEMHLVHYNAKYDADEAASYADGLAVIGIFLEEDKNVANSTMSDFLEAMMDSDRSNNEAIRKVSLKSLLPQNIEPWVRYKGSLTTPPCLETVKWTVLLEPVPIRKGLARVANKDHDDSYRPLQPLNNRTLYVKWSETNMNPDKINNIDSHASHITGPWFTLIITLLLLGCFMRINKTH